MCKVHTGSHEITNEPYVSSNYENSGKTVTADLTTNYDAETNTSLTEKIKNVREHNFEGGANNSELDKDTDRSNLNSKVKHSSSVKYPVSVIGLYWVQYLLGTIWYFLHSHYYYCTSDRECWFALRMELSVLSRRHDEYS